MEAEVDLEAMSASAAVFVESDYGRYLIGRLNGLHLDKHQKAENVDDSKVARLMHEAAAIREVLQLIDDDVSIHTTKFFETQRKEVAESEAQASIAP